MDISIININDLLIDKIQFSKSFSINRNQKKISIGYNDQIDLYILSPIFISSMSYLPTISYQSIKLRFEPMLGPMIKFYNLINQIEHLIRQHILKHNTNYTLCSIIKNDRIDLFDDSVDDYTKYISLSISNDTKYFNHSNEESTLSNLKINFRFKTLLKIDSIWINTHSKKFGLKIEMIQLKIIKPITSIKCLIDNDLAPNQHPILNSNLKLIKSIEQFDKKESQLIKNEINNIVVQQQQIIVDKIIFRPPDPSQLLQLKNSLKKIIE
jgi:hypothetical protein